MRGTPDELLLAQKLINDLDKARPEVVVDIAVHGSQQELGAQSRHLRGPAASASLCRPPSTTSSSSTGTGTGSTTGTGTTPPTT